MNMKTRKVIAIMASVMMLGAVATACGDSNKGSESKTPHTTYSVDDINNMSNDELEKALENAANEIEMSENAAQEVSEDTESDGINMWDDVVVTFNGADGFALINIEYVGDIQAIKDNVEFHVSFGENEENPLFVGTHEGEECWISAIYDENVLRNSGIVLKKNIDSDNEAAKTLSKFESIMTKGTVDVCSFTATGLGKFIEVNENTDPSIFYEAVDAFTAKAKKMAESPETYGFYEGYLGWMKNDNIRPIWGAVMYVPEGYKSYMSIAYVDENGNCIACHSTEINCFFDNGEWCKDVWVEAPYAIVTEYEYASNCSNFDEWKTRNYNSVCFEIN